MSFKNFIVTVFINLISKTWRVEVYNKSDFNNTSFICVFWHGYMLPVWKYFSKYNPTGVVSQSRDGEILSSILKTWNFELIRGSSSTDSKIVLNKIINSLENKNSPILLTPDGPRGPNHNFKIGAVVAAFRAEKPIILCKVKIKSKIKFHKSWDKFEFPLPFSKIILDFSDFILIPKESSREQIEEIRKELEYKLNN